MFLLVVPHEATGNASIGERVRCAIMLGSLVGPHLYRLANGTPAIPPEIVSWAAERPVPGTISETPTTSVYVQEAINHAGNWDGSWASSLARNPPKANAPIYRIEFERPIFINQHPVVP